MKLLYQNIILEANRNIPGGKRKKQWIPYWKEAQLDTLITERDNLNETLKTNNTLETG